MLLPSLASAQEQVTGIDAAGVTYNATVNTDDDKTVTITGLGDAGVTELNIPATITATMSGTQVTYMVTKIGAGAFSGNTQITSLAFEENQNFTSIGAKAFAGCSKLTNDVVLPAGVNVIDDQIFANCPNLRSVKFTTTAPMDFVNTTGTTAQGAFAGDKNLEYIDMSASTGRMSLPSSLTRSQAPTTTTAAAPFYNLPAHTMVYLPQDVTATYAFMATQPANAVAESAPTTDVTVTINSKLGNAVQPWTLVGYDYDNDGTFSIDEKPSWVNSITMDATTGNATVELNNTYADPTLPILTNLNNILMNTPHVGNLGANPYDLSTHSIVNGKVTPQNTANSYIIPAAGTYNIPLVYGNAIKDGAPNTQAYTSTGTGTNVLTNFVDNEGNPITSPYIYDNHTIEDAKIVWSSSNLLQSATISPDGHYLQVRTVANIENGNAMVAVIGDGGNVLWSWHLWFTTNDALNVINIKGLSGDIYGCTTNPLGWVYTGGTGTVYTQRTVNIKVKQTGSNITQDIAVIQDGQQTLPKGKTTFYQWGRKDPFPGALDPGEEQAGGGAFTFANSTTTTVGVGISNPDVFYYNATLEDWNSTTYLNLWSANNTQRVNGQDHSPVIKTIYDPSPVGFHVPAPDLFSGICPADDYGKPNAANIATFADDMGYLFYTDPNVAMTNTTIFFPAAQYRGYNNGTIYTGSITGNYWSAMPVEAVVNSTPPKDYAIRLSFNDASAFYVRTNDANAIGTDCARSNGYSVRPVAE